MNAEHMRRIEKFENAAFVAFLVLLIVLMGATPEGKMLIQQMVKLAVFFGALYTAFLSWFL
jgi:hypothetical protein